MKAILLNTNRTNRVYSQTTFAQLKQLVGMEPTVYTKDDLQLDPDAFRDVEFVFSTWGMPVFTEEEIRALLPSLKCVFYAAGTVQQFARPFLNCGIKVFSAWAANAVPVAEYTVAQIILANKGFYATSRLRSVGVIEESRNVGLKYPGNFDVSVGIIGAGMIGKMVLRMLKQYRLQLKTFDPFLPDEKAAELGVKKCSLEELFSTCQVVSNHLANNEQTKGMLGGKLFDSMLPYATFINTGRGAQVVEADLVHTLETRPDLTAILDVTYPEPPEAGHAFYQLPNCILTPHIAGSSGNEVHRMPEYMVEEYLRYAAGEPCLYEVNFKMLETMA